MKKIPGGDSAAADMKARYLVAHKKSAGHDRDIEQKLIY
jgi:hypothetical protein